MSCLKTLEKPLFGFNLSKEDKKHQFLLFFQDPETVKKLAQTREQCK